jgi:hypothetical protein
MGDVYGDHQGRGCSRGGVARSERSIVSGSHGRWR